jgi:hypothetical protein
VMDTFDDDDDDEFQKKFAIKYLGYC